MQLRSPENRFCIVATFVGGGAKSNFVAPTHIPEPDLFRQPFLLPAPPKYFHSVALGHDDR